MRLQIDLFLLIKKKKTKKSENFLPSDVQSVHWGVVFQGQKRTTDIACISKQHAGMCIYLGKNANLCFCSWTQNPYFNSHTPVSRMQNAKVLLLVGS